MNEKTPTKAKRGAKLWGGRFSEATDEFVEAFTASVNFDRRLYPQDIRGSIAHANMLSAVGVITTAERDEIVAGLQKIHKRSTKARFLGLCHLKTCT